MKIQYTTRLMKSILSLTPILFITVCYSQTTIPVTRLKSKDTISIPQSLKNYIPPINRQDTGKKIHIGLHCGESKNSHKKPLFIIDGKAMNSLPHINPNNILSINILKDSTGKALYGSKGANGVIILKTKKK